jgi:hypothetical protein
MTKTTKTTATRVTKRPLRKAGRDTPKRRPAKAAPLSAGSPADAKAASAVAPIRRSKKAWLLALLERPDGAAISDLTEATGWQVHSVRAALTGFRKDGKELIRAKKEGGMTRYRIAAEA